MSDLITQTSQNLALQRSLVDDGDIPSDKLIIPRINLLQALSEAVQEGGQKQGTFHNSVTSENYGDVVTIIPIKINFGSVYIVQSEGMKCKSVDGVTNMFGDACAQCPFGVYYKGEWKDGKPPKCAETIDILGIEASTGEPAIITFKNTSYKEGRRIITTLKMRRGQALSITLGADREKNDNGIFYVLKLRSMQNLSNDQFQQAAEWKASLSGATYQAHEEVPQSNADLDFPPRD